MIRWRNTNSGKRRPTQATEGRLLDVMCGQSKEPSTRIIVVPDVDVAKDVDLYTYNNRPLQSSYVFLYILMTILACLPGVTSAETCAKKLAFHTFRYRNCVPVRRIAPVCIGSCRSYSMTSRNNPFVTQASCTCCQAVELITAGLSLKCPVLNDDQRRFYQAMIRVKLPKTCLCRPCTFETTVESNGEYNLDEASDEASFKLPFILSHEDSSPNPMPLQINPKTIFSQITADMVSKQLPVDVIEDASSIKQPPKMEMATEEINGKKSSKQVPQQTNERPFPNSLKKLLRNKTYPKQLPVTVNENAFHGIQSNVNSEGASQEADLKIPSPRSPAKLGNITFPKSLQFVVNEDEPPRNTVSGVITSFNSLPLQVINKKMSPKSIAVSEQTSTKVLPEVVFEDSFLKVPLAMILREPSSPIS
uniref:CTCK domain-containing protein n=2 Tax=Biomphalaria glabrata TaxID=6526 RepID=A0A2C9LDE8_BIOGL